MAIVSLISSTPGGNASQTNEFIPSLSYWDRSFNVRVSGGYSDNLLLSHARPESSAFINTALDAMLLRLPLDGKEFTLFLSGEDIRYTEGKQLDHEQYLIGLARFKISLDPHWNTGMDLQYLYQDQVIDLSVTETNPAPTRVQGNGITARPSLRRELPARFWVEFQPGVSRQLYRAPLDDYWEGGTDLTAGRDYRYQSSGSITYRWRKQVYDTREELGLDGAPIAGSSLEFVQHEVEAALRHNFDSERHWRSTTKVGVLWNEDSGPGYFNFARYQASGQLRYAAAGWEIKAHAKVLSYEFVEQVVSDSDPSQRRKQIISCGLRGQKAVFKAIVVFAEYARELSLSNRQADRYEANRVSAGVDWGF